MKCPNCGFESQADDEFCVRCGSKLPPTEDVPAAFDAVLNFATEKALQKKKKRDVILATLTLALVLGLVSFFIWRAFMPEEKWHGKLFKNSFTHTGVSRTLQNFVTKSQTEKKTTVSVKLRVLKTPKTPKRIVETSDSPTETKGTMKIVVHEHEGAPSEEKPDKTPRSKKIDVIVKPKKTVKEVKTAKPQALPTTSESESAVTTKKLAAKTPRAVVTKAKPKPTVPQTMGVTRKTSVPVSRTKNPTTVAKSTVKTSPATTVTTTVKYVSCLNIVNVEADKFPQIRVKYEILDSQRQRVAEPPGAIFALQDSDGVNTDSFASDKLYPKVFNDVLLVTNDSGYMAGSVPFAELKNSYKALLQDFNLAGAPITTAVGGIVGERQYDSIAVETFSSVAGGGRFYHERAQAAAAIDALTASAPDSRLFDAIAFSLNTAKANGTSAVFLATIGLDTGSLTTYDEVLSLCQSANVPLHILMFDTELPGASNVSLAQLQALCEKSHGIFEVANNQELAKSLKDSIQKSVKFIKGDFYFDYTLPNNATKGRREVILQMTIPGKPAFEAHAFYVAK